MHKETMAPETHALFSNLASAPWLPGFYLAGGTALALRLGHRTSVDLGFFAAKPFDEALLVENLAAAGKAEILQRSPQSVIGILDGVKFSFLGYPYPMLKPLGNLDGISIASIEDIACMKLDALASRGTKRDFIDVYFVATEIPLADLMALFKQKYASVGYNPVHLKKSLVFFEDAEGEPMPAMRAPVLWTDVKRFFVEQATSL